MHGQEFRQVAVQLSVINSAENKKHIWWKKQAGVILESAVIDSAVSASLSCEVDKKCLPLLLFYHSQQLPELLSSSGCLKPAYTSYKVISLSALTALD